MDQATLGPIFRLTSWGSQHSHPTSMPTTTVPADIRSLRTCVSTDFVSYTSTSYISHGSKDLPKKTMVNHHWIFPLKNSQCPNDRLRQVDPFLRNRRKHRVRRIIITGSPCNFSWLVTSQTHGDRMKSKRNQWRQQRSTYETTRHQGFPTAGSRQFFADFTLQGSRNIAPIPAKVQAMKPYPSKISSLAIFFVDPVVPSAKWLTSRVSTFLKTAFFSLWHRNHLAVGFQTAAVLGFFCFLL